MMRKKYTEGRPERISQRLKQEMAMKREIAMNAIMPKRDFRKQYRKSDALERAKRSLMADETGRAVWAYWEELCRQDPRLEEAARRLPR